MTDIKPITKEEREATMHLLSTVFAADPRSPVAMLRRWEAALVAAEAEILRLREALRPFAEGFEQRRIEYANRYANNNLGLANFDKMPDKWELQSLLFTMGDFRRARAALDGGEK